MKRSGWIRALLASLLVISAAVVVRVPSCHESFWVDELHSAWVVADEFNEVAPRASIGNQTPYYFQLLWVWQRLFGDGELAMRASSVLFSSLAAGVLTLGIVVQTQRIASGIIAGGIIAIDQQAVFFGCELRPYAAVMLCASLGAWSAARILDHKDHNGRHRFLLALSVCVAALLHPTSLGILGLLTVFGLVVAWLTKKIRFDRWDVASIVMFLIVVILLAISSLPESWQRRDQWRAFALARDFWQLRFQAWAWGPIVYIPLGVGAVLGLIAAFRKRCERSFSIVVTLAAGVVGTLVFFFASYAEIVPLWHRRYFIAALPLLAWSAGMLCGYAVPKSRAGHSVGAVIAVGVLLNLIWCQGPRELRHEHWREAVVYLSQSREPNDTVWVDGNLIEGTVFQQPIPQAGSLDRRQREYLAFPVRGPYPIEDAAPISLLAHNSWRDEWLADIKDESNALWVLARGRSRDSINRFAESFGDKFKESKRKRFGNIVVVFFQRRVR